MSSQDDQLIALDADLNVLETNVQFSQFKSGLFENTSGTVRSSEVFGCLYPEVDPYKVEILKLSGLDKTPITCEGFMLDLTSVDKNQVVVNSTKIPGDFKSCRYREIVKHPTSDKDVKFGEWSEAFNTSVKFSESVEFFLVECENKESKRISKTYHALFPPRDELYTLKLKKRTKLLSPAETLNVLMVGMDGLSRHQFLRSMNLTYTFLKHELDSFDMEMYTQLGKNTFPNYLPLLTGYNISEVEEWWEWSTNTDEFDLVWGDFRKAGFRTLYTEDIPSIGGFHYEKPGFKLPPTTYYSRPVSMAMEGDKDLQRHGYHCAGNIPDIVFHLNYMEKFFDTYPTTPIYAMSFFTKLTHDDMTNSKMADAHMFEFYKAMKDKGHLNNTVVITFSDHGPRWGAIRSTVNGMVESRSPYAIFSFPKWFLDKYPGIRNNLKTNTHRLTTHFDTHATLQDLIYFKPKTPSPLAHGKHGISLFKEIPINRTCEDIPIPLEFCLCDQVNIESVPRDEKLFNAFSEVIVLKINSKRNKNICEKLKLQKTLQLLRIQLPKQKEKDKHLFKIRFQTNPGEAIYEGTIQTPKGDDTKIIQLLNDIITTGKSSSVVVGDTVDRLNLYKGQADCENDASKKPYCYCKNLV